MRRKNLKIRKYKNEDIVPITLLGKELHDDFKFKLDVFSNCLVLEENERVIGFIIYSVIYDRAEIIDIIIDSKYRLKGYVKKLLDYVIDKIKETGCLNVTLEVACNNLPAIKLYESLGFVVEAKRKNYYDNTDGYLMMLDLR